MGIPTASRLPACFAPPLDDAARTDGKRQPCDPSRRQPDATRKTAKRRRVAVIEDRIRQARESGGTVIVLKKIPHAQILQIMDRPDLGREDKFLAIRALCKDIPDHMIDELLVRLHDACAKRCGQRRGTHA
jgi:hypothetical protein